MTPPPDRPQHEVLARVDDYDAAGIVAPWGTEARPSAPPRAIVELEADELARLRAIEEYARVLTQPDTTLLEEDLAKVGLRALLLK